MATASTTRVQNAIRKNNNEVIYNPNHSEISANLPRDIRLHHLFRSLQVLDINQQMGRFTKTEFDVFVGRGGTGVIPDTSKLRRPPNTTRRQLSSLTPEWAEEYLPFPGRIYFTSAAAADLWEAFAMFITLFNQKVKRSGAAKNHPYRLSETMSFYIDGALTGAASMKPKIDKAETGTLVQAVNYSPHAATLELWYAAMYNAAKAVFDAYSPGIAVSYSYINSDAVGLTYGRGTGGPSRAGKATPVVYALPMVSMWIPVAGRSNAQWRPIGLWRSTTTKGGKPRFRKRSIRAGGRGHLINERG